MFTLALTLVLSASDGGVAEVDAGVDAGAPVPVLPELRRLAKQLEPKLTTPWVKQWLGNVSQLKSVTPKTWYCVKELRKCFHAIPEVPNAQPRVADDDFLYARITDPLAYARPFEIANAAGFQPNKKKVLDFGYGNLGQLLMLARLGAEVHGVEVDPLLVTASTGLVGKVGKGSVVLHDGFFAGDEALVKAMGSGYALWISKNTLKRGYVHPAEPPGAKGQIDLGLDDAKVLSIIHGQLAPKGLFLVYNVGGAATVPYKPMTDVRCPFSKEALTEAGFEVIAYDEDDTEPAKAMAELLEWERDWPNMKSEINVKYTLARKR